MNRCIGNGKVLIIIGHGNSGYYAIYQTHICILKMLSYFPMHLLSTSNAEIQNIIWICNTICHITITNNSIQLMILMYMRMHERSMMTICSYVWNNNYQYKTLIYLQVIEK